MTARDFDPVLSAALRNELEALADGAPATPVRPFARLRRPQVWITAVTALVLLAATLGVLRQTTPDSRPATTPTPAVVDPLSRVTDPASPYYVARSVTVLLAERGRGTRTAALDVPAGVTDMRVYLNCTGKAGYGVEIDREGTSTGSGCDRDSGSSASRAVRPGGHTIAVKVRPGVRWSLLVIRTPGPTLAPGALIDPGARIRDLRDPDALVGDVRTLLGASGIRGDSTVSTRLPSDVRRARVYLVCAPASATTTAVVDGHLVSGCQNAVAHWFDLTPAGRTLTAAVRSPGGTTWSLLVVRAPEGAGDSPANTALPYPGADQRVLARARGAGAAASGSFLQPHDSVGITTSCRGTGWLEVQVGASGTTTRGTPCSTTRPSRTGFGGEGDAGKRHRWTVVPHGDISWTFALTDD